MRLTLEEKLEMVKKHEIDSKSISHVSEEYDNYSISNLKYLIQLYRKAGDEVFLDRSRRKYQRDTKLLAIKRVKSGESIRQVSLDLNLLDPSILEDWIKLYDSKGLESIKDTYARGNYLTKDKRAKQIVDQALIEENNKLKAEIEYLKKSQSLTQKLNNVTNKEKAKIVTELRKDYDLKVLLKISGLSSSTYYYNLNVSKWIKPDKYKEIKEKIEYLYVKKHEKRMG